MKLISVILALTLSMNVFANTVVSLEKSLNDYHYALTVEWDQKDLEFYEYKTKEFFENMILLIKEEGLSEADVLKFAETKMDKSAVDTLKMKLSLLSKKTSVEELTQAIKESSQSFYDRGASWNGEILESIAIGLAVAGLIGYAIWFNANNDCVSYGERLVCNTKCRYKQVCTEYVRKD